MCHSCCRMSACSPRCRVRDKPNIDIKSTMVLYSSSRRVQSCLAMNCLLGFRLLRSIGTSTEYRRSTAAVVPSYLISDLAVPLVEVVQWRPIRNRLDTHSSCWSTVRFDALAPITSLSMSTQCSLTQFVVWSGQSIEPAPILLMCCLFRWSSRSLVASLFTIDCEQLDTTNR